MNEVNEDIDEIKVILIGDTGVGKTNLINTCVGLEFEEGNRPTVSGSFVEKIIEIKGKKYSLNLWDTAGQEAYRGVTKLFFKGAQIIVLVYDITNYESFKSLDEWINISQEIIDNYCIYGIVGNKNDLFLNFEVKEEEARSFAEEKNFKFKIVSAKTDPQRFSEFLTDLVKVYKRIDINKKKNSVKLNNNKNDDNGKKNCIRCISNKA